MTTPHSQLVASTSQASRDHACERQPVPIETRLLDLGTYTGLALLQEEAPLEPGTLHLAGEEELELQRLGGRERAIDTRFARICGFISQHLRAGVNRIVFEDVGFCEASLCLLRTARPPISANQKTSRLPISSITQFEITAKQQVSRQTQS